jgi:aminoglycoside phosphotransferase (APT) family kinase protein
VIGTWFYVMEHVAGRVFWDASFPDVTREQRPHYCYAMVDALARLHNVDPAAVGLADYGKPGNYFQRQIARWSKQYQQDAELGRMPAFEKLIDWLQLHTPAAEEASLVHGDYRCDNVIFHPTEPRVLAILDWELSTIGNPLADFGYHLMMYRMPTMAVTGIGDRDLAALNIPTEADYVAEYCRLTGRRDIPELEFYLIFNFFRLAAVFHGIRIRMLRGTAASVRAREYAEQAEPVAAIGWRLAQRATAEAKA